MKEHLGFLFKQISEKITAHADADLKRQGVTFSQLQVLICLHTLGGKASQKELERSLQISHPAVVGLVARLKEGGFVDFYMDSQDRRNKMVYTLQKADQMKQDLDLGRNQMEEQLQDGLTGEERKELFMLLHKILDNLS